MKESAIFYAKYDEEEDMLFMHSKKTKTKESVEVLDDVIIDIDRFDNLAGIEIFNASEFFKMMNKKITKEVLNKLNDIKIGMIKYRNYIVITMNFKIDNKVIGEKLPPFSIKEYESPLIASVSA